MEIMKGLELRLPAADDAGKSMEFVNALVREDAKLALDRENTPDDEESWLDDALRAIADGSRTMYFVEEKSTGSIVASFEIRRGRWRERLCGNFGIAIAATWRGKGLGTKLGRRAIREARRMGLKTLWLTVFSNNKPAIGLYRKLGFRKEGILRRRVLYKGKLIDEIPMSLDL